jgi:hypothetical protein
MEKQGLGAAILRFMRNVGIVTVCIFVLAGLSCLPVGAWQTFYHLGNRVMLLGVLAMVVGAVCMLGRTQGPVEQLPMGRSTHQRTRQWLADSMSSRRFMVTMGIAGGLSLFLGDLIRRAGLSALGLT